MPRFRSIASWTIPSLVTLIFYWPGLTSWFQNDDLIWLGLHNSVRNWRDLGWALFTPLSQGTIRTLSERVVFLSFFSIFGMDPLPYRCLGFPTHMANLALMAICQCSYAPQFTQ